MYLGAGTCIPYVLWWVQTAFTYITGHDTEVVIAEQQQKFGTCQFEVVLVLVFQFMHTTRRFLECIWVSVFSSTGQMHIVHHLTGYFSVHGQESQDRNDPYQPVPNMYVVMCCL